MTIYYLTSFLIFECPFPFQAETRAQFAERNAEKLQTEVDRLKDELQAEQERNKNLQEEMEATLQDIQNM